MSKVAGYFWIFIAAYVLSACQQEKIAPVPPEVIVKEVNKDTVPVYGSYIGVTQASLDVEVRARITGYVEKVEFVEGSWVEAGQLLYLIDDKPYIAKRKQVLAQLEKDKAAYEKAKRDVTRLKPLYEQDAASQLDYDTALSTQEQAKASVMSSQANLDEVDLELSYTKIKAPISGMIGGSQADIGALVGSGGISLLTTVQQIDPIYVTFNMSSLDYLNARRRMNTFLEKRKAEEQGKTVEGFVRITLPDDSEYKYWGDVSFTDPKVNPKTGTFKVRAVLPNPDSELLPGQYTSARIRLSEFNDAVVIEEEAVRVEQGGLYVMVVMPDNTVEHRFVMVKHYGEQGLVIDSGLNEGERIIIEGQHRARHGQLVKPLTESEYKEQQAQQKATNVAGE
ncbi:efflux RND transporter periplasmic adaptor subunit [Litorilituus lipolyticus]|uniref:Efflux RND transporter periplasmic adaptor subunit n=1 Tax=Litorilituus lipolyticus TaxID=2491017 RepID=A0A502KW64_9GAMM|nr:efflux RND transporter periplasmic adaptor subunit [Litorilituus lipolyticus]TPH15736.1 efflux RND transporter periplasmic adaptor subunit [Litorilituus lipolyticus]